MAAPKQPKQQKASEPSGERKAKRERKPKQRPLGANPAAALGLLARARAGRR